MLAKSSPPSPRTFRRLSSAAAFSPSSPKPESLPLSLLSGSLVSDRDLGYNPGAEIFSCSGA